MEKYPCLGMRSVSSLDGDNSGVMQVNTTELLEKVLSHITPAPFKFEVQHG